MNKRFVRQKTHALNELAAAERVGDADESILPLLSKINALEDYYTTSSCAGRILLFQDLGSKKEDKFLGAWHRRVEYGEIEAALKPAEGVVWFRMEPAIIHVIARGEEAAARMLKTAYSCGFKRSGIASVKPDRWLIEVLSTERVDAPVMSDEKLLVDEGYLRFLVEIANEKYEACAKKLARLETALKDLV